MWKLKGTDSESYPVAPNPTQWLPLILQVFNLTDLTNLLSDQLPD